MNVISLQNIEKSYGTRLLFTDVSITFTNQKRLGLVGINGTGKSTFLKILTGQMEADKGSIERNGKASIHYLAQSPNFDEGDTLLEAILDGDHPRLQLVKRFDKASRDYHYIQEQGVSDDRIERRYMQCLEEMDRQDGWQVEQEARIILSKLGFHDVNMSVSLLSGGQKRRLALGQALLYPCDLLLLDEPTNHLDEDSIEWLETYLSNRQGGLLISTHDRYFLDSVCNGILELSNRHMYEYEGNYEKFIELKANREARQAATEEKRRQFLKREIEWVRRGALARTTKQKARLQRYETLKNMEKTRRPDQMDPIALKTRLGKTIFDIEHLSFDFDGRPMIDDFTYHVVRHDRIGIVGPNGVGKSTFMNILDGTYEPSTGTIGKGETVRIAHFKQELPEFDEDMRVLDYIKEDHSYMALGDGTTLSAGQILERFLFTPELHGVPIRKLSGGERRRLYLLKLLMSAPNVLLLDEPTNDLDIPTLEVLEDFLDSFSGVIITVCHDRYFLDRVVDKLFVFTGNGHIDIVHGSYSDYKEEHGESTNSPFYIPEHQPSTVTNKSSVSTVGPVEVSDADTDTNANTEVKGSADKSTPIDLPTKKGLNKAEEAEYASIMEELPKLEHLIKGLDVMISQAATDYEKMQTLMAEREGAQSQIDTLTERWMELEERL
ncbi:ABC-F family ATP-binding cassette domain-containing protein [Veillonella tobetsuensis]|uniref:ABC-F family ATP-binding cassette domain-containing protein n=1 Tax=Veillonella tobetsuensis TaxID=1110546 RepID=UPI001A00E548|nr:ABC-F family ATP-binding cassette domain-containing protein [Veillonella tobetsuensis]MBF1756759.1 ABC-F family ATP-binding cassette domain-containing protein [Veillonella tobetsuensis]